MRNIDKPLSLCVETNIKRNLHLLQTLQNVIKCEGEGNSKSFSRAITRENETELYSVVHTKDKLRFNSHVRTDIHQHRCTFEVFQELIPKLSDTNQSLLLKRLR